MASALYREDLDSTACNHPGCTHTHHGQAMMLTGACHPSSPVRVQYFRGDGRLGVSCGTCGHPITVLMVAGRPS